MPFSIIVAGRYNLAPAIWVYGANMILLGLTAIGITLVIERDTRRRLVPSGRPEYGVLIAFGYSLDGNRLLQPRWRDVRLFPQSCFAAGPEMDRVRLSHAPDQARDRSWRSWRRRSKSYRSWTRSARNRTGRKTQRSVGHQSVDWIPDSINGQLQLRIADRDN